MYQEYWHFEYVDAKDKSIWRYMNFTKFMSMLEDSCLHFTRTDTFEDHFEGALTQPNIKSLQLEDDQWQKERAEALKGVPGPKQIAVDLQQEMRRTTGLNCWYVNQHESAAMWKLYAATGEGIAIRSSIQRLIQSLDTTVKDLAVSIGLVNYIDYGTDRIKLQNAFSALLHKRLSFSHERELRAVAYGARPSPKKSELYLTFGHLPVAGVDHPVNLETLIDTVFVSPTAPPWYDALVRKVVAKYGLSKPVHTSNLSTEPIW